MIKPRYIRINVNIISREDALTAFRQDGWMEVEYPDKITYDEFIQSVKDLKDEQFIKDLHVKNLYIFPPSSKGYWAKHYMVRECQLLLQDKVRYSRSVKIFHTQSFISFRRVVFRQ